MHVQLSKRQQEQIQELNDLMKNEKAELSKQMAQEINEMMLAEKLPAEFIPDSFQQWLNLASVHETQKSMGTGYEEFKRFWLALRSTPVLSMNIWEMGFAINCVESKSESQLECDDAGYIALQDTITEMTKNWNNHANSLKQGIVDKYNDLTEKVTKKYGALIQRVADHKPILMPNKEIIT